MFACALIIRQVLKSVSCSYFKSIDTVFSPERRSPASDAYLPKAAGAV